MERLEQLWWRMVRFGFRLLYNEMAFTYDVVSWVVSLGEWRAWQRTALDYLPSPAAGYILEIAHGTGNLHLDMVDAGYTIYGHDLSTAMGRITHGKFERRSITPKLSRGYAQELPYQTSSFAAVVSTFPTDFIIQEATLREIHRVLQEGGRFVIVVNGVLTGGGIVRTFLEWLYRITGQRDNQQADDEVSSYFEDYGFGVQTVETPAGNSIAYLVILTKETAYGTS